MENLVYLVTNKFITVAVDSNLEISMGEGNDKINLVIPNAKKVEQISDTTIISILGLPHKITDLYNYILGIKNSDKSFDGIIEDLESIFNSNLGKIVENLTEITSVIPKYTDSKTQVLDQKALFEHFKNKPELLQIAKEAIELMQSGTKSGTQIAIFTRENNKNYVGRYLSIGMNFSGSKSIELPKDHFHFGIISTSKDIEEKQAEKIAEIQSKITNDWELTDTEISNFEKLGKDIMESVLTEISPFKSTPNIIFYQLNNNTNNRFVLPEIKLTPIKFSRK